MAPGSALPHLYCGNMAEYRNMQFWRTLNILSIDIALGAMAGCAFFSHLFHVSLRYHAYLSLGMIVWLIYTADHLLDVILNASPPSTDRHRFHLKYRKPLLTTVLLVGLLVIFEAFFIRKPVLVTALVVSLFVALYLVIQRKLKYMKEAAGAVLYTAGVLTAPVALLDRTISGAEWVTITLFTLTAFINLMLCSLYDVETDLRDNHRSFTTTFGIGTTRKAINWSFIVTLGLAAVLVVVQPASWMATSILLIMNTLLVLVYYFDTYFSSMDRYRLAADLAFLVPLLYMLSK